MTLRTDLEAWLIRKLGGYTAAEYDANRAAFDQMATQMESLGKATIIKDGSMLMNSNIEGSLVAGPYSTVIGGYFECKQ